MDGRAGPGPGQAGQPASQPPFHPHVAIAPTPMPWPQATRGKKQPTKLASRPMHNTRHSGPRVWRFADRGLGGCAAAFPTPFPRSLVLPVYVVCVTRGRGDMRVRSEQGGSDESTRALRPSMMHPGWTPCPLPLCAVMLGRDELSEHARRKMTRVSGEGTLSRQYTDGSAPGRAWRFGRASDV